MSLTSFDGDQQTLKYQTTVPADGQDEAIARAFFEDLHRRKVDAAVEEYAYRVATNQPYEDAASLDELARRAGR